MRRVPPRPLGRKRLPRGSGCLGSASRRGMGTLNTVNTHPSALPLGLEEMTEATCPHFILKPPLRVASCLCRPQALPSLS